MTAPAGVANDSGAFVIADEAVGMVMREAKSVRRMPEAELLGASMDFAEPHGHVAASSADAP